MSWESFLSGEGIKPFSREAFARAVIFVSVAWGVGKSFPRIFAWPVSKIIDWHVERRSWDIFALDYGIHRLGWWESNRSLSHRVVVVRVMRNMSSRIALLENMKEQK